MTNEHDPKRSDADQNGQPEDRNGPQPPPPVKANRSLMVWILIFGLLILLFMVMAGEHKGQEIKSWDAFVKIIRSKTRVCIVASVL